MREFDTVGVVGLGAMGAGIVEVFARAGFDVAAVDVDQGAVDTGRERLEGSLAKALSRGKLSEADADMIRRRVTYSADPAALGAADLVVEAVPERMDLKREVFADLDGRCRPGTILATNTSSLSVTEIAALTSRPESVVGLHFFNPAPVMKLVEVVGTVATDPAVLNLAAEVAKRLGKTPVTVGDRAGFVANALLVPYLNDAVAAYERGIASREEIDAAAGQEAGLPMGPLTLADMVGLDVCLAVLDVLWQEFRSPRHTAAPLLRRMVAAGMLGRKSGRGFYAYAPDAGALPDPAPGPMAGALDRAGITLGELLLSAHLNDALRMVFEGYAAAADVDAAMRLGCGYPRGPIELAREVGDRKLGERLTAVDSLGLAAGRPAPLPTDGAPTAHAPAGAVPRRNTPRRRGAKARQEPEQDLAARATGAQRMESAPDGEWAVRTVSAAAAVKAYRCPGCAQEIPPGTPHTVSWRADGRGDDRRHWHTACWNNRAHRGVRLPRR